MSHSKFIYLTPLSDNAKVFFNLELDSFHACRVEEETTFQYLVVSLNKTHKFWIEKQGNRHWKITDK